MKNRAEIDELDDSRAIAVCAGPTVTHEMLEPEIVRRIGSAQAARYHVPDARRLAPIDRVSTAHAYAPVSRLEVAPHRSPSSIGGAEIGRAHVSGSS
jgi:hypothetical protein